ncbi:uncharacterized protein V6R79_013196 [Siganus canaliculatus]
MTNSLPHPFDDNLRTYAFNIRLYNQHQSSRRGQRAVIKLCLHLSLSLSHQLEGYSSRVPQIHRSPPPLPPRPPSRYCGASLTPSG